jgi:cytochrome c oxidase assembly factor CtaG
VGYLLPLIFEEGLVFCLESLYSGYLLSWVFVERAVSCLESLYRGLLCALLFIGPFISLLVFCVDIVVSGSSVYQHFTRQFLINWEHCVHSILQF